MSTQRVSDSLQSLHNISLGRAHVGENGPWAIPDGHRGRDAMWGGDGDELTASNSGTDSPESLHAYATASLVFRYFSVLAQFHGAVHVPSFWADLLFPEAAAPEEPTTLQSTAAMEALVDTPTSPATEINLNNCYVGPCMLLALADLVRVHAVSVRQSHDRLRRTAGKKATERLPAVRAPLWGTGARPVGGKESGREVMCSLLPQLTTLQLAHLCFDFSTSSSSGTQKSGVEVLRYLLEALQGHPTLHTLDVSHNPVSAALAPALSRLVSLTPSLTRLKLDGTLLSEGEKEMLRAQCLRNELRLSRSAAGSSSASEDVGSPPLSEETTSTPWVKEMREGALLVVHRGTSVVPWVLGKSTALIRQYTTARNSPSSMSQSRRSRVISHATNSSCNLSVFGTSPAESFAAPTDVSSTDFTYVNYDVAEENSSTVAPPPPGTTWSAECEEVVRCAFMPRTTAQQTILGGKPVWSNVPEALNPTRTSDVLLPSAEAVASSDLMRALRQQVLPEPLAPRGLRKTSDSHFAFLTTAEEAYWTTKKTQERQWGFVVQKMVENLVSLSVTNGQTLYTEGDSSDFLFFLPPSLHETSYVALYAGVDRGVMNQVRRGNWVGEAEVLNSVSLYAASAPEGSCAGFTSSAVESEFRRSSTARFVATEAGSVTIWALPFSIAFFYLYAPHQWLHRQFLHRTPMRAFARVHPVLLGCVPAHLHIYHGTSAATTSRQHDAEPASTLCRYNFLSTHVILLQEGEFLLRVPAQKKHPAHWSRDHGPSPPIIWEDLHLLSGVTLLTKSLLDGDVELRTRAISPTNDDESDGGAQASEFQGTRLLGKEAALRSYRAAKMSSTQAWTASANIDNDGAALLPNEHDEGTLSDDCAVMLQHYRELVPGARWRYAAMANEEFAALCPQLRLVLTRHTCIVRDP